MSNMRVYLVMLCFTASICFGVFVPKNAQAQNPNEKLKCNQQVALINLRSQLLASYKLSEEKQYKVFRKKWANRITYAGQWVPKESVKARDALYKYDSLHKSLIDEVDKQIKEFQYLETDPVSCAEDKKNTLAIKLEEVNGMDGKKVVGGQALIEKKKKEELKFEKSKFKKATGKMIKKLHAAKEKNPAPEKSMTIVDDPK